MTYLTEAQDKRVHGTGDGGELLTHALDLRYDASRWTIIRPEPLVDFADELPDRPHILSLSYKGSRDEIDVVFDPVADGH